MDRPAPGARFYVRFSQKGFHGARVRLRFTRAHGRWDYGPLKGSEKKEKGQAIVRYRALVSGYCARHGKARCTTNATVSGSEWHSFSRRAA